MKNIIEKLIFLTIVIMKWINLIIIKFNQFNLFDRKIYNIKNLIKQINN
jgi:hypothetical protein